MVFLIHNVTMDNKININIPANFFRTINLHTIYVTIHCFS